MKVIISAQIDVAPETRDEAIRSSQKWIDGALSQKGCLHYSWAADLHTPGRIHVYEEWASQEDLNAHFAGPEYVGMRTHMGNFDLRGATARKFLVSNEGEVYGPDGLATAAFPE